MGNTFGHLFRVTTFGESHGGGIGCVIDGCPPRIEITGAEVQAELDRRRPGQSEVSSPRSEADRCEILSGVFEGRTLGTPIAILIRNEDARPADYEAMREQFRPSHADFTYEQKFGIRNWQGGGRASARETAGRVAAGAIAKKMLRTFHPDNEIIGYVCQIGDLVAPIDLREVKREQVEANIVRCPDAAAAQKMIVLIEAARADGDSLGGTVECLVRRPPAGLGSPVFDKLEADLAKAMMSLPASKAFEVGSGLAATKMRGSEHNDSFEQRAGRIRTTTNFSGGIQGGISNGETIYFRVGFKPPSTIAKEQATVTAQGEETTLAARGRHDPCVLPRAVPIVEAMTALVLADHCLRQRAIIVP